MSVDLPLGPRPEEAGPPIGGPRLSAGGLRASVRRCGRRHRPLPGAALGLLPLLHLVQSQDGYLTAAGIGFCATQLGLSEAEVTAVATFYSMYRRTPPATTSSGCVPTPCAGARRRRHPETLEAELEVHPGQTTADGKITLEHIECNAACDYAPVVMVNWEFFDNQTPLQRGRIGGRLTSRTDRHAHPGAALCPFRETSRTLAGLGSPTVDTAGPGAPTLAGLKVYRALSEDSGSQSAGDPAGDSSLNGEQPC